MYSAAPWRGMKEGESMADAPNLGKRLVHRVDGMERVAIRRDIPYWQDGGVKLLMDVYAPAELPSGFRLPALFFVHGGPIPAEMLSPRRWGVFESYGALAAASGLVGVTFDHRLHDPGDYTRAQDDVRTAIGYVREHADELRVNPERIGIWVFSGGGPLLSWALRERPSYVGCLVAFYALLDLRHVTPPNADPAVLERAKALSPAAQLEGWLAGSPMFIARAGRDSATINQSIDLFIREALTVNMQLDVANHPEGEHAFDARNDDDRSREIITRAIAFVQARLSRR